MSIVAASDPLTAPTWLTAIFTGVLALFAFATAFLAWRAFRAQSEELNLLREDRWRDTLERRRAQAALVYVTFVGNDPMLATVHNTGQQPVYDVRVHWVQPGKGSQLGGSQVGEADVLGTLAPAATGESARAVPEGEPAGHFVPVVYFRDAAGQPWTVMPDGLLEEVKRTVRAGAPEIGTNAVRYALAADLTLDIGRALSKWRESRESKRREHR